MTHTPAIPDADRERFARYLGVPTPSARSHATAADEHLIRLERVQQRPARGSTRYARPDDFACTTLSTHAHFAEIEAFSDYLAYGLDLERRTLTYTHADRVGALDAPFLYLWQREHGQRLAHVPFERLPELGDARDMAPCFVLSPGRTGTTLLVQLLRAAGFGAVSEPDSFTNLAVWQADGEPSDPLAGCVARAAVENFRVPLGAAPLLKLRGACCLGVEAMHAALPQARWVFLLRDRHAWACSQARAFGFDARALALLLRVTIWAYTTLLARGARPLLFFYEDLLERPAEIVAKVAGIAALAPWQSAAVVQALARDAQRGSPLARDRLGAATLDATALQQFDGEWQLLKTAACSELPELKRLD